MPLAQTEPLAASSVDSLAPAAASAVVLAVLKPLERVAGAVLTVSSSAATASRPRVAARAYAIKLARYVNCRV